MTQREALDVLKFGCNVYLTGPAGSGKTYLLNQYIAFLKGKSIGIGITASTGIAATHMNGRTIHSWAGLGVHDKITQEHLSRLRRNIRFRVRMNQAKVLIIDEVSMLHSFRLDMVDTVCRTFKDSTLPFGGMQVILSGDFFQLPPVSKKGEDDTFVNTSNAWKTMELKVCYLTEQFRQQDKDYLRLLNCIRDGFVPDDVFELLLTRLNKPLTSPITPTKLYTHNVDVDAINSFELDKITTESKSYKMFTMGDKHLVEALKGGYLAPEELVVKKGAVVMFVKNNFDKGYVNGTLGKVTGFDQSGYPNVETIQKITVIANPTSWEIEENGVKLAEISQVPLRLAWAITVHKSQGMSLDAVEIDLSKAFAYGMGYVALSRAKTLQGIKLTGLNDIALQVNEEARVLDKELYELSQGVAKELDAMNLIEIGKIQKDFIKRLARD